MNVVVSRQASYPDSDGKPIADNTLQFDWISILKWGAEACFAEDPAVFVAGDHLIYPVEGNDKIRAAPDVYVAFGRPKGYRGSYKVFREGGLFPQVIFEVWSPNNTIAEMEEKREFYEKYGAEEYYIVYPEFPAFVQGWQRNDDRLVPIPEMNGFVSPRLGFRFDLREGELTVFAPDGSPLRRPDETQRELVAVKQRAEQEKQRAEHEKQRADEEARQKEAQSQRAEKLAARLRELGVDPDQV